MKKKICLILSILMLLSCLVPAASEEKILKITENTPYKAYIYGGRLHIPLEDVLPFMGYTIEWDASLNAYSIWSGTEMSYVFPARNNIWVGNSEHVFYTKPFVLSGKTYISDDVFKTLTGCDAVAECAVEEYSSVILLGGEKFCYINGNNVPLAASARTSGGQIFIPIEETLPRLGFALEWDASVCAYKLTKNGVVSFVFPSRNNIWIGPYEYIFENTPLVISGRTLIPADMFSLLSGVVPTVEGIIPPYRDRYSVLSSQRSDAYRLPGNYVVSGGGVTVVDGFGMELPSLSESSANSYASVINSVAASLSPNINVYNILVPTAAEYYAPLRLYPNQLSGIKTAYAALDERVTPVNVYDILAEKAGEHIYFKTDHHWTQRGAYYAYTEFMKYFDVSVPDIGSFENYPTYNHVGSLAGFAKGTSAGNIMQNSPELLERFMPKYASSGQIYYDGYLSRAGHRVNAVNTNVNAYHNFIGGDNPITVFDTSAQSDRVLVIIKESFGNAFATWALNDFKRVCVVDPRRFNGFSGNNTYLNLNTLCSAVGATDVLFINYPIAAASSPIRNAILKMR